MKDTRKKKGKDSRGKKDNRQDKRQGKGSRDSRDFKNSGQKREYVPRFEERVSSRPSEEERFQLEGRNAVLEALKNERSIDKILIKKGETQGTLKVIVAKAREKQIVIQEVDKAKLDEIAFSENHQGIIALCSAIEYAEVDDILDRAKELGEEPLILILDGITDTHNMGAIIRTAEVLGVHGVIIPKRRTALVSGIVSKVSAGAIEYIPIAKVPNIPRVIDYLKSENIWTLCTTMEGESSFDISLKGAMAIVIGSEGEGVSRLVKEKCDLSVSIPMFGKIESYNASVAAGIVMYECVRQRNR